MNSGMRNSGALNASTIVLSSALIVSMSLLSGCANAGAGTVPTQVSENEVQWSTAPFGPDVSPVSGDFSKGSHITYVKFPAGMVTPLHTHSSDYVGIVVSGTTMHWLPGQPQTQKVLPAGSHWSIPANAVHVSECLPGAECVMAISQQASFDFLPVANADLDDSSIIAIFDQVNGFDVEAGQLASIRGDNAEVRQLGKRVMSDHTAVRKVAGELAGKQGIRPVLPVERAQAVSEHKSVLSDLKAKSGADFDRAYLLHEIRFHTNAIASVKDTLLPNIANSELKSLVIEILPGFEHHLNETKRIAGELGYN